MEWLQLLLSSRQGQLLSPERVPVDTSVATVLDVPAKAMSLLRSVYVKLLMEERPVIAILAQPEPRKEEKKEAEKDTAEASKVEVGKSSSIMEEDDLFAGPSAPADPDGKLVLYGQAALRCAAAIRAMVLIEQNAPETYSEDRMPSLSIAGTDDASLADFGGGLVPLGSGWGGALGTMTVERHLERIAEMTGAVAERLNSENALFGGTGAQRRQAASLLPLLFEAPTGEVFVIPSLPSELDGLATKVRVPDSAYDAVRALLTDVEKQQLSAFWIRPPQESKSLYGVQDEDVRPGSLIYALYEGAWVEAKVEFVDKLAGKALIEWAYDKSQSDLDLKDLRPKMDKEALEKRQRSRAIGAAWTLILVGPVRARKALALKALASCEEKWPGLWSTELLEAVEELRGTSEEDAAVNADARYIVASTEAKTGSEPTFQRLTRKDGPGTLKRIASAANCIMKLFGTSGFLVLGTHEERARALEYLAWRCEEPPAGGSSGSTDSGGASVPQSVDYVDADGDRISFRCRVENKETGEGPALDMFLNGEPRIRDILTLRPEGADGPAARTLQLSGTSCTAGSKILCTEVPEHVENQGAPERILELFRSCSVGALWARRRRRGDVSAVASTCGRNAWLEGKALWDIEVESNTIILLGGLADKPRISRGGAEGNKGVGKGGKDAESNGGGKGEGKGADKAEGNGENEDSLKRSKWHPKVVAEVHICGHDAVSRARAAEKVKALIAAVSEEAEAEDEDEPEAKKQKIGEVEVEVDKPVDARAELRKLGFWPKDYPAWREVQDIVWKHHQNLAQGWLRVWARSKDREYYVRFPQFRSTFDINEAL
mmetsp:Transcript_80437/g.230879  ORF Transcript_80437/g.230879 Transcript_80437/m.230879 type:complete len:832 (-) Transcript_80437:155-2650(-)